MQRAQEQELGLRRAATTRQRENADDDSNDCQKQATESLLYDLITFSTQLFLQITGLAPQACSLVAGADRSRLRRTRKVDGQALKLQ